MSGLGQGAGRARDAWNSEMAQNIRGKAKTAVVGTGGLMVGLAAGGIGAAKKAGGATFFVFLGFLLFLFDVASGYRGFYITNVDPMGLLQAIWSFGYVVFVFMVFIYLVSQDRSPGVLASWAVLLIVVMITLGLIFRFNPIAITHLVYILLLWFFFVRGNEGTIRSNKLLIAFLLVDLYAFSILNWLSSLGLFSSRVAEVFVGFPFLFIATNVYVWEKTHNTLSIIFLTVSIIWYGLMGGPQIAKNLPLAGFVGEMEELPFATWGEFWKIGKQKWIEDPLEKATTAGKDWLSGQIQYAIHGKVEENQYEPLGVYLERVQSADPKYYEDEDALVWGTVNARTLDDPINIKVGCFVKKDKEKMYADKVEPDKPFSVFALEENDFACSFNGCDLSADFECESAKLKSGSNIVTTFADFNFETLAYLKAYFINKERQRAMVMEEQDVFEVFDITDKNPTAVYTNGPAEIGMKTTTPLIGVSDDYIISPVLDFSLKNRDGWEGKITNLTELVLFLPNGVDFDYENGCNNKKFLPYIINECDDDPCCGTGDECETCYDSCERFVYNSSLEVCDGFFTTYKERYASCVSDCGTDPTICDTPCGDDALNAGCIDCKKGLGIEGYISCVDSSEVNREKCENVCSSLFNEGDQEYKGYSLDLDNLRVIDELKDFEKLKLFRCRFTPKIAEVLGTAPITTKYFRIKARYDYSLEKNVNVKVERLPDEIRDGFEVIPEAPPVPETPPESPAAVPVELGEPNEDGIYKYDAPGPTTPIWYRYTSGAWEWTPYDPTPVPDIDCWMPVTEKTISNDCGGGYDGNSPAQENIVIINYLAENNPVPP